MSAAEDPREARLPKWARDELASLRRRLSTVEQHVRDMAGDVTTTDTVLESALYGELPDQALPPRSKVAFRMRDSKYGGYVRVYLQRDQWAGVQLHIQGDRSLVIKPSASNTFYIEMPD